MLARVDRDIESEDEMPAQLSVVKPELSPGAQVQSELTESIKTEDQSTDARIFRSISLELKQEREVDAEELESKEAVDATRLFDEDSIHGASPRPSKGEDDLQAQSPSLNDESLSETPRSRSQSVAAPVISGGGRRKGSTNNFPVQLIGDLPVAREEASKTFNELDGNVYQNKSIGKSHEQMESMTCECIFRPGDNPDSACGPHSDCINRLTQIECLPEDCRCGSRCQNQRFQQKQYARIEIVLTEKKGYGLRAESDFPRDTFIYEYVGDVVSPPKFKQRMRDYADEGIKHFYFMMLQKDEFIDATKSGGIGRFANHSCNPNCYVAKWTVGNYVRMGIYAKRNIQKHEELTFNYNVDRYGHQAQTCYCGEPNCVGFIGGKTQTDVVTLDDLYLDALGIDEDEMAALKGTKKRKGKKIDDPDFMPEVKPLRIHEVPKLLTAIRGTGSKKLTTKLLMRIQLCTDEPTLFSVLRLRGFSVMYNLIAQNKDDIGFLTLVLQTMAHWPLLTRNKVDASKVPDLVKECAEKEGEGEELNSLREVANQLLAQWESLKVAFRIAKRAGDEVLSDPIDDPLAKRTKVENYGIELPALSSRQQELQQRIIITAGRAPRKTKGWNEEDFFISQGLQRPNTIKSKSGDMRDLIAQIAKEKEEAEKAARERERLAEEERKAKEERREKRKLEKERRKNMTEEEKEAAKEKRLLKLIGAVVVKCMSKHQKALDNAQFKKYAKELTQTIADKEKKSSSYKNNKLDSLSPEKVEKIKKFSKQYISKLLHKLSHKKKAKGGSRGDVNAESSSAPGSLKTDSTPADDMDVDGEDENAPLPMSVEEAMDLEADDSDSSDEEPSSPAKILAPTIAPEVEMEEDEPLVGPTSVSTLPPRTIPVDEDMDPPDHSFSVEPPMQSASASFLASSFRPIPLAKPEDPRQRSDSGDDRQPYGSQNGFIAAEIP